MYRGNSSRFFPIVVVLIVVAISIAALVSLGQAIFGGGTPAQKDTGQQALTSTDGANSVSMTVRGPITADEEFHTYTVLISPSSRSLVTYTGYMNQVLGSKQLNNNEQAYEQFVYALNYANFMKDSALTGDKNDIRGICAGGSVYQFSVLQNGSAVKQLWTSTCRGSAGSFHGSVSQISSLFLLQIPNSADLLRAIDL